MARDPLGLAYLNGVRSPLHQLNPASKMIWLTCVVIVSFAAEFSHLVVLAAVCLVIAVGLTGTRLGAALKPIKLLVLIWGPFVLMPPLAFHVQADLMGLAASDTRTLALGPFQIPYSAAGLAYGGTIFLRGFVAAMATVAVVWTTHPRDIVYSLTNAAHLPYRVGWAIFLALIYTPLILHEYQVVTYAKQVRGLRNRRGPIGMVDSVRNTFLPLLVRGLRKGNVTSLAMESRAFGAEPTRTFRHEPPRSVFDRPLAWASIVMCLMYLAWSVALKRVVG